jgi:endonuclease III
MPRTNETLHERRQRLLAMMRVLKRLFPAAGMVLKYGNDWELLVAVMLSAQCTDVMVNRVTEKLFKKYRSLDDYLRADPREFEQDIRSTGFYKNKTKNVLAAAKIVKETFGGKLPRTMSEMLEIPGVARKTANVVLGNAHDVVEGIAVDTHVRRFVIRFDLSDFRDPVRIEEDLMKLCPRKDWFHLTYLFIEYGRQVCPARKHDCDDHPLTKIYPAAAQRWPKAK